MSTIAYRTRSSEQLYWNGTAWAPYPDRTPTLNASNPSLYARNNFSLSGESLTHFSVSPVTLTPHFGAAMDDKEIRTIRIDLYTGNPFDASSSIFKTITLDVQPTYPHYIGYNVDVSSDETVADSVFYKITLLSSDTYLYVSSSYCTADLLLPKPEVTLTAPLNTEIDGSVVTPFSWTIDSHGLSVNGTEVDVSKDNGNTWTRLFHANDAQTSCTSYAFKLDVGPYLWRAGASNRYTGYGDYATGSFSVDYPQPVVTLSAPLNTTLDGAQQITFSWDVSAENGSLWCEFGCFSDAACTVPIDGTATRTESKSVSFPAAKFAAGTVYWRVKARYSPSPVSSDYATGSFTVSYSAPTVDDLSPDSADPAKDGGERITLSWEITPGSGSVTGTQVQRSSDGGSSWETIVDSNATITSTYIYPGTVPAGTLQWRVRARDQYAGWSEWTTESFSIVYSAVSQVKQISSPWGGSSSNAGPLDFQAFLEASTPVYEPFKFDNATLYWRAGTSGDFTSAGMTLWSDDTRAIVQIPADTFPLGTVQWYIEGEDTTGRTTSTPVYTITIVNALTYLYLLSPSGTVESGTSPITFSWRFADRTTGRRLKTEIQYRKSGSAWNDLGYAEGDATAYTAAANTIPAGLIEWRARVILTGGTAGDWSAALSFECMAAAVVGGVILTGAPYGPVTWNVDGQLSYKIRVDGRVYGPYFGVDVRSFALPDPLPDGLHTAEVAVQNKYGLWSEWVEGPALIENSPGDPVTLTATGGESIALSWATSSSADDFDVYRDGVKIGHTGGHTFVDRVVLGEHRYEIVNRLPGGFYTRSNSATATAEVDSPALGLLSGGAFLSLRLSENANRDVSFQRAGEVSYIQYAGADFPEAETGEAETLSASGDVSFPHEMSAEAAVFESLLKKPAIYKTPGGAVVVGVLAGYARRDPLFFKSYTFEVQQMRWRDFVDEP